jgi:hypothetical protein
VGFFSVSTEEDLGGNDVVSSVLLISMCSSSGAWKEGIYPSGLLEDSAHFLLGLGYQSNWSLYEWYLEDGLPLRRCKPRQSVEVSRATSLSKERSRTSNMLIPISLADTHTRQLGSLTSIPRGVHKLLDDITLVVVSDAIKSVQIGQTRRYKETETHVNHPP